ncbi:MAG: hypothetical protein K6E29_03535 [Cyanobacteria bacterium RUI128]|nr:hypothetical protein [Cyanobacteria bacterium RUI128]
MLKKFLITALSIFVFSSLVVFAGDDWSDYNNIDNAWDGQKTITNKQFEETMDALQARSKKKEAKKREKTIRKFKGSSLTPEMDAHNEEIVNEQPDEKLDENQLITVPVDFIVNGQLVERGFYKVEGEKKTDGVYILLYQAHVLKAKIKAKETNDDFNEEYIKFARVLPCNDHQMKIIFGCVDFNAFAYITFIEPES